MKDLVKDIDYPKLDLDECAAMFKQWEHHKEESILGYRNHAFALARDRHEGARPPHAVVRGDGRFDAELSGDQGVMTKLDGDLTAAEPLPTGREHMTKPKLSEAHRSFAKRLRQKQTTSDARL